jgi:hypothetical protein
MSNSERGRAFLLALRVIIFCAPLLFGAYLFEFSMYRTRDSWPIKKVIEAQAASGGESLLGRANFSQQYNISKSLMISRRRPRILALGSSRVMEFRSFMFHPYEAEFYNGGGLIQTVNDFAEFARQVREGRLPAPQVLIVGIDPWWVSEATDPPEKKSWLDGEEDAVYKFSSHVEAARYLIRTGKSSFPWKVAFGQKQGASPYYNYPSFGIAAISAGVGERFSDGSFLYTAQLLDFIKQPVYRDRLAIPVLDQVKRNYFLFAPSRNVERVRARILVQSLASLKASGIEVYAYEPPFSTEVRRALDESQTLRTWWTEYKGWLREQLEAEGISCLPLVRQEDYGLDDTYMLDGIHAGEVFDSYILESLVKQAAPGSLLASIDLNYLAALRKGEHVIPLAFEPPPGAPASGGKISAQERRKEAYGLATGSVGLH